VGKRCVGASILMTVWLRGKIYVGKWCCEVVESCKVQQVAWHALLLPCNLINTCVYVCVRTCMRAIKFVQFHNSGDGSVILEM